MTDKNTPPRPLIEIARELLADPQFVTILRNLKDRPVLAPVPVCRHHDAACAEVPVGLRCKICPLGVKEPRD